MVGLSKFSSAGADKISAERMRQINAEGYTVAHDHEHTWDTLSDAGAAYAIFASWPGVSGPGAMAKTLWPSNWEFKPANSLGDAVMANPAHQLKDLVRAGALIAAAIDRLLVDHPELI